jgi:hypothetical protein
MSRQSARSGLRPDQKPAELSPSMGNYSCRQRGSLPVVIRCFSHRKYRPKIWNMSACDGGQFRFHCLQKDMNAVAFGFGRNLNPGKGSGRDEFYRIRKEI